MAKIECSRKWTSEHLWEKQLFCGRQDQRQQNTIYPKGGTSCEKKTSNLIIGPQPIKDGMSLVWGRRG